MFKDPRNSREAGVRDLQSRLAYLFFFVFLYLLHKRIYPICSLLVVWSGPSLQHRVFFLFFDPERQIFSAIL